MAFIVWAETQAAMLLGGLLSLIKGDPAPHELKPGETTTTTMSSTETPKV